MSFEISSMALLALIGLSIVTAALLYGWQGWLALKERQLEMARGAMALSGTHDDRHGDAPAAARIELADLKERVRRLEAIASGVDL